jgi:hypothetical protein
VVTDSLYEGGPHVARAESSDSVCFYARSFGGGISVSIEEGTTEGLPSEPLPAAKVFWVRIDGLPVVSSAERNSLRRHRNHPEGESW